ncbi:MAG: sugar phosphate isomerase/epimerase family protein [Victivallales bacterium]|jgi:sugar phosphate isomerase/epimerase
MKIGVCANPNAGEILKAAGFDFIEMGVSGALRPDKPYPDFVTELDGIRNSPLPCLAVNCLLPGHMKICGPAVNLQDVKPYLRTVCERANDAGIEKIVFGSGGARKCPEGFDRGKAFDQLVEFGKILGEEAANNDILVAVEPLNRNECNMLCSVNGTLEYVKKVGNPNFRLHADSFHWGMEEEEGKDFTKAVPYICHTHIATYKSRMAPGQEESDFARFFKILRDGGYNGTISIEGKWAPYGGGFSIDASVPSVKEHPEHLQMAIAAIKKHLT